MLYSTEIIEKITAQDKSHKEALRKAQDYCYKAIENLRAEIEEFATDEIPQVLGNIDLEYLLLLDKTIVYRDEELEDCCFRLRVHGNFIGTPILSFMEYDEEKDEETKMFTLAPCSEGWKATLFCPCTFNTDMFINVRDLSNVPWENLNTSKELWVVANAILRLNKFVEGVKENFKCLYMTYKIALSNKCADIHMETINLKDICDKIEPLITE